MHGEPSVQIQDEKTTERLFSREHSLKACHTLSVEASENQQAKQKRPARRHSSIKSADHGLPDAHVNVGHIAASSPVQNLDGGAIYRHENLEERRKVEKIYTDGQGYLNEFGNASSSQETTKTSRLATQVYTLSYLVLFSMFGTLARLGLQALTEYERNPVIFLSAWPNFAGCFLMGFLSEDRMLFKYACGTPTYDQEVKKAEAQRPEAESRSSSPSEHVNLMAAKKAHAATKKTIPLYIGLGTGFCGSLTSFSSFIRDIILALFDDLESTGIENPTHRNGGQSFMALLGVLIVTMTLSLSGLFFGEHLAIALQRFTPNIPYPVARKILDPLSVFLAVACWTAALMLSALPPDQFDTALEIEKWRGRATIAICFAPFGCLGRFYLSIWLNGTLASFPVGTFIANLVGTAILGAAWVLQHGSVAGVAGCQVWQGMMDGFCGCLTTVSTFATELAGLRRKHAYIYGVTSILAAIAILIAIMGGLRWSIGYTQPKCET